MALSGCFVCSFRCKDVPKSPGDISILLTGHQGYWFIALWYSPIVLVWSGNGTFRLLCLLISCEDVRACAFPNHVHSIVCSIPDLPPSLS